MDNPNLYLFLGGGIHLLLFLIYKTLKKPRVFWSIFVFAILLSIVSYINLDRPTLQMKHGNAASWLFLPILFLISFSVFRKIFIWAFGNEPLMTGYMQTSWEQGEYRKLHYGDAIFTISCLCIPLLIILIKFY